MWALGGVHRGAWAPRFWSSPGCLFHHAYPPGYRASKAQQFGRTFAMSIAAGPTGPIFQVHLHASMWPPWAPGCPVRDNLRPCMVASILASSLGEHHAPTCLALDVLKATKGAWPTQVVDESSGRVFTGNTPTQPWTQVCLAHRTGQRISGAHPPACSLLRVYYPVMHR